MKYILEVFFQIYNKDRCLWCRSLPIKLRERKIFPSGLLRAVCCCLYYEIISGIMNTRLAVNWAFLFTHLSNTVKPVISGHPLLNGHQLEPLNFSPMYCEINPHSTDTYLADAHTNIKPFFCTKHAISGHSKGCLLLKASVNVALKLNRLMHCLTGHCAMRSLWSYRQCGRKLNN